MGSAGLTCLSGSRLAVCRTGTALVGQRKQLGSAVHASLPSSSRPAWATLKAMWLRKRQQHVCNAAPIWLWRIVMLASICNAASPESECEGATEFHGQGYVYREELRSGAITISLCHTGRQWELWGGASPSPQVVREASWRRHLSGPWKAKSRFASGRRRREVSRAQGTACTKHRDGRLLSSLAFGDTGAGKVTDHSSGQAAALQAPVKS